MTVDDVLDKVKEALWYTLDVDSCEIECFIETKELIDKASGRQFRKPEYDKIIITIRRKI